MGKKLLNVMTLGLAGPVLDMLSPPKVAATTAATPTKPEQAPNLDDAAVQAAREAQRKKAMGNVNDKTGGLLATDYTTPTVLGG